MNFREQALAFACEGERLAGIVSRPDEPGARGVLVVVGGPQVRTGSHRQFTHLCRALAARGIAAMRFDYRGMGDSEGEPRDFEGIGADIRAALDRFLEEVPALREVVIWGLCDAASAALFYAHRDARVTGLALANPWVRTPAGEAQAFLRHYYLKRLLDPAFWGKLARGEFALGASLRSLADNLRRALRPQGGDAGASAMAGNGTPVAGARIPLASGPLPERMAEALARFRGRVLLILSGDDLTAKEFVDASNASRRWRELLSAARVTRRALPAANHTFSRRVWRDQVADWTAEWVESR